MDISNNFPGQARARFWFVFWLFVFLMLVAHGAAELCGWLNANQPPGLPGHSVLYYRVIFTIWASLLLLTPALCFHIFSTADNPNTFWRPFWTFAYLAFLAHLYWTLVAMFHLNWTEIFHSQEGVVLNPEHAVNHPGPDLFLAAWWGFDVLLAWLVKDYKWVRVQRGAVHLLTFVMFFGAFTLQTKASMVAHLLGIVMFLVVIATYLVAALTREPDPKSLSAVLNVSAFQLLNKFVPWHKLPTFLGLANLSALRQVLRAKNLHNTSGIPVTEASGLRPTVPFRSALLTEREEDGQYNDLSKPTMGNASLNPNNAFNNSDYTLSNPGARFGRNIPLSEVDPTRDGGILEPSPRLVSNRLLARPVNSDGTDGFTPASILNLLAAAWIQFQTHDWFNHGNPRPMNDDPFDIPLPPGDTWPAGKMIVRRTHPDPTRRFNDGSGPTTYTNAETHWWDSSQIYGDSPISGAKYRAGSEGKLRIDPKTKMIPLDPTGVEVTGLTSNWWLGLSILHNLFTLEHNAICDRLLEAFPEWIHHEHCDDEVFRVARLVNSALMAKIHTVDWTTAILTHPALLVGMPANWAGLTGEHFKKYFGRISSSELISGIPGSALNQDGADFCLTEEFVAVYRLHPLLPNSIQVLFANDGRKGRLLKFGSDDPNDPDLIVGPFAMKNALGNDGTTFLDLLYSFGLQNPGAVTLRNYPNWLRQIHRRNGPQVEELIDMATIDVLRDRERGVPRYNRFRELFHLPRINSFEKMTDDPELARELREIYGHPDKVDLMVGMYAEKPPAGFGFSDTAFRVFILMASRRFRSDRFFTTDFTPAVYTQPGLDWIYDNNMNTVLLRHFPELAPVLLRTKNAFAPWSLVESLARN